METHLQFVFQQKKGISVIALLLAGSAVGYDIYVTAVFDTDWLFRVAVIVCGIAFYKLSTDASWKELGFKLTPTMGWRWWCCATAVLATVLLVVLLISYGIFNLLDREFPRYVQPKLGWWNFNFVFLYPVAEEWIYRFLLCLPLVAIVKPWAVIVVSGNGLRCTESRQSFGRVFSHVGIFEK